MDRDLHLDAAHGAIGYSCLGAYLRTVGYIILRKNSGSAGVIRMSGLVTLTNTCQH